VTYEQIINELRKFQQSHKQLKSFFEGDIWDYNKEQNRLYPVFIATLLPSQLQDKGESFTFQFGVFDKVNVDGSNRVNVLSDTRLIVKDFNG